MVPIIVGKVTVLVGLCAAIQWQLPFYALMSGAVLSVALLVLSAKISCRASDYV